MFKVIINNIEYQIQEGLSIIEACDSLGIKIPRFCYLKGLSIPANCRVCLVEVKGNRKLVPACTTLIANNMEIFTDSENVRVARKKMIGFLLINHPLDCPICDEGGECELQNQAIAYGFNDGSYDFSKRARVDLNLGPLISTSMTRCINCTRCIRFLDEVAGEYSLGLFNRGENSNISNYFQKPIYSELSGNLVDICPVGALNNAQYLFRDRPWQLTSYTTIDIIDSMCNDIILNMDETEIVRILPIDYPIINKAWSKKEVIGELNTFSNLQNISWISDKTRYSCDALDIQRIDSAWIKKDGKLKRCTFQEAYKNIKCQIAQITGKEIAALAGRFADVESMLLLKELMQSLESDLIDCRLNGINFNSNDRNSYIFNSGLSRLEEADCIIIVGSNPKKEVPVLNAKIRSRVLKSNIPVGVIGENIDLNYPHIILGNTLLTIEDLIKGNNNNFTKALENAKKPMLIVGEGAFINQSTNEVLALLYDLCNKFNIIKEDWNGYNFINTSVGNIGGLDIGFTCSSDISTILNKASTREVKFVWLLNADELDFNKLKNSFVVYIGHHGDKGAEHANIILPAALWLEKNATFVNIEGKALESNIIKLPPNRAKADWEIIKEIATFLNKELPYNNLNEVRNKMAKINPVFANYNNTLKNSINLNQYKKSNNYIIKDIPISSIIEDYYLTDVISRNSKTLAQCSKVFSNTSKKNNIDYKTT